MSPDPNSISCINSSARCVRVPHVLGAGLLTGTDKIRNGFGNGDGILLDFRHRVFAVADATERFPWSSRRLLKHLAYALEQRGNPRNAVDFRESIRAAWLQQPYNYKTTLSCIALERRSNATICHIFNGGDSRVFVVDASDGAVLFHTPADMNFAGRTRQLPDVTSVAITDRNFRLLLATDGFQDVLKSRIGPEGQLPVELVGDPVHRFNRRIRNMLTCGETTPEHDDIAAVLIQPFGRQADEETTVILGGTTPAEEAAYREYTAAGVEEEISLKNWRSQNNVWTRIGIRVYGNEPENNPRGR